MRIVCAASDAKAQARATAFQYYLLVFPIFLPAVPCSLEIVLSKRYKKHKYKFKYT